MASLSVLWSVLGSLAVLQTLIPPHLRTLLETRVESLWNWICRRLNRHCIIEVHEDVANSFEVNRFYREVELYLSSLDRLQQTDYLRVQRSEDTNQFTFSLPPDETIEDTFKGAQVFWTHCVIREAESQQQVTWYNSRRRESSKERRSFSLKMSKTDRLRVMTEYFDHISNKATEIERRNSLRKLYTNDCDDWEEVDFKHPSSFDTLALAPDLKESIKADLKAFSEGEKFYHTVGRAWKRGYLLYGPPGTGKSSLIAAMANLLQYDIYDLELTSVTDNAELKKLLIRTTRKAIIVIEDIDCSLDLSDRAKKEPNSKNSPPGEVPQCKVTLSGLLNFTDGLWSCCGEERIFVFTTNHKDRLDPALLRSGRMDFHIFLSYCTFSAFKLLAANYLGVEEHELYENLEAAMGSNSNVTPAEVVELLLSHKETPDTALNQVMRAASRGSISRGSNEVSSEEKPEPLKKKLDKQKRRWFQRTTFLAQKRSKNEMF